MASDETMPSPCTNPNRSASAAPEALRSANVPKVDDKGRLRVTQSGKHAVGRNLNTIEDQEAAAMGRSEAIDSNSASAV